MDAMEHGRLAPAPEYRPMRDQGAGDGSMRTMALAAVAIAAVVMGGVYLLSGRHAASVPVIEADSRPLRIKPTDPGGMQIAAAEDALPTGNGGAETDQLAPPPESPAPQVLRQQARAAESAAAPADGAPAITRLERRNVTVAPPIAAPALAPVKAAAVAPAVLTGHAQVQLAALDSAAAANAAWTQMSRRMPELLAGRRPAIAPVTRDGKMFWRLRTGGFADTAAATAFCAKVRAKGGGCVIAA